MRMILFTALYLMLVCCLAQTSTPKNELGINLYGNEMSIGHGNYNDFKHFPFYGLQYKRSLTHGYWLRSSIQFYSESHDYENPWGGKDLITNKLLDTRIGIEKVFNNLKKIRPFVLVDIDYRQQLYDYTYSLGSYNTAVQNLGAYAGVGFKYYPIKQFYICAETSIGFTTPLFEGNLNISFNQYFNPIKTIAFGIRF